MVFILLLLLSTIPLPGSDGGFLLTSSVVDVFHPDGTQFSRVCNVIIYDGHGRKEQVITTIQRGLLSPTTDLFIATYHYDGHGDLVLLVEDRGRRRH